MTETIAMFIAPFPANFMHHYVGEVLAAGGGLRTTDGWEVCMIFLHECNAHNIIPRISCMFRCARDPYSSLDCTNHRALEVLRTSW